MQTEIYQCCGCQSDEREHEPKVMEPQVCFPAKVLCNSNSTGVCADSHVVGADSQYRPAPVTDLPVYTWIDQVGRPHDSPV